MRYALILGVSTFVGFLAIALAGCATDQPGASYMAGSYTVHVAARPDKVTSAAKKACVDLKLTNIQSTGTEIDGRVNARTAQGDDVTINIVQAGEKVSNVRVRVGVAGDEAISRQLVDRIKDHLSWF